MINIAHSIGSRKGDWIEKPHKPFELCLYKDKQTVLPPIVEPPEEPIVTKQFNDEEFELKLEGTIENQLFED